MQTEQKKLLVKFEPRGALTAYDLTDSLEKISRDPKESEVLIYIEGTETRRQFSLGRAVAFDKDTNMIEIDNTENTRGLIDLSKFVTDPPSYRLSPVINVDDDSLDSLMLKVL